MKLPLIVNTQEIHKKNKFHASGEAQPPTKVVMDQKAIYIHEKITQP